MAKPAERIVLLRGRDLHELAMLLGDKIDDRLIAWGPDILTADKDAYDAFVKRYPKLAKIPMIGSIYSDAIDVEQLLALKPDLVVGDTFMVRRGYKSIDRIREAGLPLILTEMGTNPFEGPQKSLAVLAKALGKVEVAEGINAFLDEEIGKVFDRLPRTTQGPSIYIECGNRGVNEFGHTFGYDGENRIITWGAYMHRLHCENIALGVVPDMATLHPEQILKSDPDVIIVTGSCWTNVPDSMRLGFQTSPEFARARLIAFTERPGWAQLQSVRTKRIYGLYHGFCFHPTAFAALQQIAKWIYPQRFRDLDPDENLRRFYDQFVPVELTGVWMSSLEVDD
ncbi:ABC transporter substrate-binding protein [Gimesia fumaroli]|uniref:ABC transporter substrate-binding protein n=1 Tax=Gimesia fumaroli TaxID=2527976 RepID=UPI0018D7C87C|nr:ABC transporter substrate-binding protein [Gimesia fumaroli]